MLSVSQSVRCYCSQVSNAELSNSKTVQKCSFEKIKWRRSTSLACHCLSFLPVKYGSNCRLLEYLSNEAYLTPVIRTGYGSFVSRAEAACENARQHPSMPRTGICESRASRQYLCVHKAINYCCNYLSSWILKMSCEKDDYTFCRALPCVIK